MIKEYMNELMIENEEKLKDLEQNMKNLLGELDAAKEWLETLQAEKNIDKNIFSPRTMDTELKRKTEEARNNIRKIEQDIDHVRLFIEEHLKKREELTKLLEELKDFSEHTVSDRVQAEDKVINDNDTQTGDTGVNDNGGQIKDKNDNVSRNSTLAEDKDVNGNDGWTEDKSVEDKDRQTLDKNVNGNGMQTEDKNVGNNDKQTLDKSATDNAQRTDDKEISVDDKQIRGKNSNDNGGLIEDKSVNDKDIKTQNKDINENDGQAKDKSVDDKDKQTDNREANTRNRQTEISDTTESGMKASQVESSVIDTKNIDKRLLESFLSNIYKKTELCLALLYSDRIKCKSELKNMKVMIRDMDRKLKEVPDTSK